MITKRYEEKYEEGETNESGVGKMNKRQLHGRRQRETDWVKKVRKTKEKPDRSKEWEKVNGRDGERAKEREVGKEKQKKSH